MQYNNLELPSASVTFPGGQGWQLIAPYLGLYVLIGHGLQCFSSPPSNIGKPLLEKVPGSHNAVINKRKIVEC